jgi:hypothetical protein
MNKNELSSSKFCIKCKLKVFNIMNSTGEKKMKTLNLTRRILGMLLITGMLIQAQAQDIKVSETALCEGVKNRVPVGIKTDLVTKAGKIYFWTLVEGVKTPTEIKHRWLYQGKTVLEIPLKIKSSHFRTWSCKNILPRQTGEWEVSVLDQDGNCLKSVSFKAE